MPAPREFHQGDDVDLYVPVYETIVYGADGEIDDNLSTKKNVTGATVTGRVGLKSGPLSVLEKAGSVVDGAAGIVLVRITAAESALLAAGSYDIQVHVAVGGEAGTVSDERFEILQRLPAVS